MDSFLTFLADNYIWFLVGAGVLLLALIGLIVDSKKKAKQEQETFAESSATTETFVEPQTDGIIDNAGELNQGFKATPSETPSVEPEPVAETPAQPVIEPVLENPTPVNENIEAVDLGNSPSPVAPPEAKEQEVSFSMPNPTPVFEEPVIKPEDATETPAVEINTITPDATTENTTNQ